jgi:RecA/RadA recombinase
MRTKSGSWILDTFLNGGYWGVTTLYGQPGAGISTICLLAATSLTKNESKKVMWIDTENSFSVERCLQLSPKESLNNIFVMKPGSMAELTAAISKATEFKKLGLIIIDSIITHYRLEMKRDRHYADVELDKQLRMLKRYSLEVAPVIMATGIYCNIDTGQIIMIGGDVLKYYSNTIVQLEKLKNATKATMIKPGKKQVLFKITEKGIEPFGGQNG